MNFLFLALVIFLTLDFLMDVMAEWLNLRQNRDAVPIELKTVLTSERYRISVDYLRTRTHFGLWKRGVSLLALVTLIALGGLETIDQLARRMNVGPIVTGLAFFGILGALQWSLQLPFTLYSIFRIETKFGFNRMTLRTFWSDQAKGLLLTLLLGAPALAAILAVFKAWGDSAWLYAWIGLTLFQLVLAFVAPAWIMPLFNRFSPLPAGALSDRIAAYAKSQKFTLEGIYTMDGSKRSNKSNAFFTGLGRFRRLVFFDTLLAQHTEDELLAVLAHEIGHYRLKHIPRMLGLSIAAQGILFFVIGLLLGNPAVFAAFGVTQFSVYAGLVFVTILYSPISRVIGLVSLALSRRYEFEADAFAVRTTQRADSMIEALRRLSADNLSDLVPHPLKVMLDYSHPPVLQRIEALRLARTQS